MCFGVLPDHVWPSTDIDHEDIEERQKTIGGQWVRGCCLFVCFVCLVCLFGCLVVWLLVCLVLLVEHCCGKKKIKDETILERP